MDDLDLKLKKTVEALENKKIVCIPTDTIYGISANAFERELLKKVMQLKRRESPFILLMDSINKVRGILNFIPPAFLKLKASGLIPGPITMLFKVRAKIDYIVSQEGKIAIRIPSYDFLKKVLYRVNFPIISTSANISGLPPARNIKEAKKYFGDEIDLYIDSGTLEGEPSTIIDLSSEEPKLIREGRIKFDTIMKQIKK